VLLPLNSPPPDGLDYGFGTDGPPKTYATCTGQNVGVVACLHDACSFHRLVIESRGPLR